MARDETDREDLLREATALVERIELRASHELCATGSATALEATPADNIIVGFRLGGAMSIFFDADPVYQFNATGELRRAYHDGLIYKASHGRLVSLERHRTPHEVELIRRDLSDEQQSTFIVHMSNRLQEFAAQLSTDSFQIIGQMPPQANILGRVRSWFAQHNGLPVAQSASVASA